MLFLIRFNQNGVKNKKFFEVLSHISVCIVPVGLAVGGVGVAHGSGATGGGLARVAVQPNEGDNPGRD